MYIGPGTVGTMRRIGHKQRRRAISSCRATDRNRRDTPAVPIHPSNESIQKKRWRIICLPGFSCTRSQVAPKATRLNVSRRTPMVSFSAQEG